MKKIGTIASSLVFLIAGLFATTQTLLASVFVVSTSEELQAALSAAASNGGDDEIFLGAGTYFGNLNSFRRRTLHLESPRRIRVSLP